MIKSKIHIQMLKKYLGYLLDSIYPPYCLKCKKPLTFSKPIYFCKTCFKNLSWINDNSCRQCGRYVGAKNRDITLCNTCRCSKIFFQNGISILNFASPVKELLFEMKYSNNFGITKALVTLMQYKLKHQDLTKIDLITYVPIHPLKQKERGFNQSELLAKELSSHLNIKVEALLKSIKEKSQQAHLKSIKRGINVHNCFRTKTEDLSYLNHVLLIDDVMTTASTLNECAKELRRAKVKNITVLSLMSVPQSG